MLVPVTVFDSGKITESLIWAMVLIIFDVRGPWIIQINKSWLYYLNHY